MPAAGTCRLVGHTDEASAVEHQCPAVQEMQICDACQLSQTSADLPAPVSVLRGVLRALFAESRGHVLSVLQQLCLWKRPFDPAGSSAAAWKIKEADMCIVTRVPSLLLT